MFVKFLFKKNGNFLLHFVKVQVLGVFLVCNSGYMFTPSSLKNDFMVASFTLGPRLTYFCGGFSPLITEVHISYCVTSDLAS